MVKGPELVKTYATEGRRSLRKWHIFLRRVTFGCALLLMVASIWALHWACELIGLPPVISWVVPLAMEAGMASVASVATTIRKDKTNKQREKGRPGSYYVSLWLIFSFIMALAQAANIAHALVEVQARLPNVGLPPFIPDAAVFVGAGAFAALFPMGGTLLVHVSGFLRERGVGANWIDGATKEVLVETEHTAARATRAPRHSPRVAQSKPVAAREVAARASSNGHGNARAVEQGRTRDVVAGGNADAYARYVERMDAARARGEHIASDEPSGKEIGQWLGGRHEGHGRNVRTEWRKEYATERGMTLDSKGRVVLNPKADERAASSMT